MMRVSVYLAAGFATAPNFMGEFGEAIKGQYAKSGVQATLRYVFPYGDWSRSRWAQLAEIRRDLAGGGIRRLRSIGGSRLAEAVAQGDHEEEQLILIGHSAGGMSSVHAARILLAGRVGSKVRVVQIGSPKCPVPGELRDSTLYLFSVNAAGRKTDTVTRLGRWGGHLPGIVQGVTLVGDHKDYFRNRPPFADAQGMTNMEHILQIVFSWLKGGP